MNEKQHHLGPELSAIANHPWVVDLRDDREESGLWGIKKYRHNPEIKGKPKEHFL